MAEPKYLLDTSVCIRVLAGTAPQTVAWLETLAVGEAAVSAITYAEFLRGELPRLGATSQEELERKMPAQSQSRQFFRQIPVLPFREEEALAFGQLLARRPSPGRLRADWLIAAHALSLQLVLVTDNPRDFKRLHPELVIHSLAGIEDEGQWP